MITRKILRNKNVSNTLKNKFYAYVSLPNDRGCMLWIGSLNSYGYGEFRAPIKYVLAHRFSYELNNDIIPDGLCVCHKCDVRNCVAPDHLFLGTKKQNNADKTIKGRATNMPGSKHPMAKLNEYDIIEIRKLLKIGMMGKDIAKQYNVCKQTITLIKQGKMWKHVQSKLEGKENV